MLSAPSTQPVARPDFTFPPAEGDAVRLAYEQAEEILEYGSGGSTVFAAELAGKRVTSVESDGDWVAMMQAWFEENPPRAQVELVHADIGPTKEWGHPRTDRGWRRYAAYPLAIWDRQPPIRPDVVLVDGRFRTGCALACAFRTERPLTLLFDDYASRTHYHEVEEFIGRPEMIGRLAVFDVAPMPIPAERLLDVIRMMTRP